MKKITWGHGVFIALGTFVCFILGMIFIYPSILFPNGDKKWLVSYADVALNGTRHTLHDYSPEVDKYLTIHCYQPEPGYCACVLQAIDS